MTTNIFVFGSNLGGRHGKGAALEAVKRHGAIYGQGAGLQGRSYAIPTKDARLRTLPLAEIKEYVRRFTVFVYTCANTKKDLFFNITAIGCGLAGYTPEQIAPMFEALIGLVNVRLPDEFLAVLDEARRAKHYKSKEARQVLWHNIKNLHEKGCKQQEIAKILCIDQPTVCRYIKTIKRSTSGGV